MCVITGVGLHDIGIYKDTQYTIAGQNSPHAEYQPLQQQLFFYGCM